jgi:DNA-binding transcriptional regulator LsrR (DeoR family)
MIQPITDEAQLFCSPAFRWQILLAKQARMERVLHLFHVEQLSTWCIGERLNISEQVVCQLLEEAERGR